MNPDKPIDSINQGVIEKLRSRAETGAKKYGVTMDRTDFTALQWLQYAQEELLDGAVYLEKLIRLNGSCGWRRLPSGLSHTGCDNIWDLREQFSANDDFAFCPFCGRRIEEAGAITNAK